MSGLDVSLAKLAIDAGCSEAQLQRAASAILRALHHAAVVDERSAVAAVMAARFAFGSEAGYHLAGLFEDARERMSSEIPWSEMMLRFDSGARVYQSVVEKWVREAQERHRDSDSPPE